jgi:hypothetical protein
MSWVLQFSTTCSLCGKFFAILRGKTIEKNILSQIPLFGGKSHPKKIQKITQICQLLTTGKGP